MIQDIVNVAAAAENDNISISDAANIVIAGVNLVLAFYIFIYQRNKDKRSDADTATLNEKNIKLQWFKDIIIQPHLDVLIKNFGELIDLTPNFVSPDDPDYDSRVAFYIENMKAKVYLVRKGFIALLEIVDPALFTRARNIIDQLIDRTTIRLIDERRDVSQESIYESILLKEVISTKNQIIKLIYSYQG